MTKSEKKKALTCNTMLWLAAMILPGVCHLAFASTRFPWPIIIPFLLLGCLLASNKMLTNAAGEPTEDPTTK
jgi:fatty acid desaturase